VSEQPLLSVRGEAVLEVEPEIANVSVSIAARDADRAKALRLLNERAQAIDTIVRGFGAAVEKVETAAVHVSPQLKSAKPRERIAGYVATVHQTITVVDFSRLGELLAAIADHDLVEVAGPWWALRPGTDAHRRARMEATHDAVRRARDYADAVGSQLTGLVELADARLLSDMSGPAPMAPARAMMRSLQVAAPEELTFEILPAKQVIHASVEARFTIAAPDLTKVAGPAPA
jgi:uncharacterized protein YggE